MIELNGKYNTAKVFTDNIDSASVSQIIELCSQEFTIGEKIRMMPDVHAGVGCVIGTTMTITDKIVPNLVGVDIGCGMETVLIKEKHMELMQLDKLIRRTIPSGFAIRSTPHKLAEEADICALRCADKIDLRVRNALWALLAAATTLSKRTGAKRASTSLSTAAPVIWGQRLQNIISSRR